MKNEKVIVSFINNERATGSNLRTYGEVLYSYYSILAYKRKGFIVVNNEIATSSFSSKCHASPIYSYDVLIDYSHNTSTKYNHSDNIKATELLVNELLLKRDRAISSDVINRYNLEIDSLETNLLKMQTLFIEENLA